MKRIPIRLRWFGWWPTRREWRVALFDVAQALRGRCNEETPPRSGGYSHWRCGHDVGHSGPHRFRNYTWAEGVVKYDPLHHTVPQPGEGRMAPHFGESYAQRRRKMREIPR